MQAQILDGAGVRVQSATPMEPPSGQSPYFGWMGADGLSTVRIESIQAMWPNPKYANSYLLVLKYGASMGINQEDAIRLMRRMGWTQAQAIARATQ